MYSIGIDFGTTKTLVSYFDHDTKNHGYVRLGRSTDKMPTTIYVGEDGSWQFGDDADDFMSEAPARYCRDFKLGLGKKTPCLTVKIGGKLQKFTAKDLTVRFLENVRIQCERLVFHAPVRSCAVTYPVAFSIAQRNELENAAKEAGFDEVHLLPEPESAGYAYFRFGVDKNLSRLMVVDWGGGTVDFAMIICKGQEVSIVPESYGGVINYGGRLFDERLFARLSLKISQSGGGSLEDDVDPMLVKRVSECKEKLSRMTSIKSLMLVSRTNVYRTEVSREEFNALIASDVDRVVDQLQALIAQCAEKPQALLLIGGSSSVPFVRERLQQLTGLRCVEWDKLNEAVALGSAWYGSKVTKNHCASNKTAKSVKSKRLKPRKTAESVKSKQLKTRSVVGSESNRQHVSNIKRYFEFDERVRRSVGGGVEGMRQKEVYKNNEVTFAHIPCEVVSAAKNTVGETQNLAVRNYLDFVKRSDFVSAYNVLVNMHNSCYAGTEALGVMEVPPIVLNVRAGLLSDLVLQVRNTSEKAIYICAYFFRSEGGWAWRVNEPICSNKTVELGSLELKGWRPGPGVKGWVSVNGYAPACLFELTSGGIKQFYPRVQQVESHRKVESHRIIKCPYCNHDVYVELHERKTCWFCDGIIEGRW